MKTTDQLFQLPNGTWIRPSSVIAIVPAKANTGMSANGEFKHHEPIPPRVIVRYAQQDARCGEIIGQMQIEDIECETFEAAKTMANEIALGCKAEESK